MSKNETKPETKTENRGRPTKYKPEYCDVLIDFAKRGEPVVKFCAHIGISKECFYEWTRTNKIFSDSYKRAKPMIQAHWEKILEDSIHQKDVNTTSLIFLMRARFEDFRV